MARKSLLNLIKNAKDKANFDYAKDLNEKIRYTVESTREKRKPSQTLKPSSIKCIRGSMYQYIGAEPDEQAVTSNLEYIVEVGSFVHEYTQGKMLKMPELGLDWEYVNVADYIRSNNINVEIVAEPDFENGIYETKLSAVIDGFKFSFLCDGIVHHKPSDKYFIFEIKSCPNNILGKMKEVPEKYHDQSIAYCSLLGLKQTIFFFIGREFMDTLALMYTPKQEDIDGFFSKIKSLADNPEMVPAVPSNADNKFCQYCQYKSLCSSNSSDSYEHNIKYKKVKGVITYGKA